MNNKIISDTQNLTTAELEYRDYVPWDVIAIEFCHLNFYGKHEDSLNSQWRKIEDEKYDKNKTEINSLEEKITNLDSENKAILSSIKESKPWYRLWYNKRERELRKVVQQNNGIIARCYQKIKILDNNLFYSADTLISKARRLLKQNGFVLINKHYSDNKLITTEIWKG